MCIGANAITASIQNNIIVNEALEVTSVHQALE